MKQRKFFYVIKFESGLTEIVTSNCIDDVLSYCKSKYPCQNLSVSEYSSLTAYGSYLEELYKDHVV